MFWLLLFSCKEPIEGSKKSYTLYDSTDSSTNTSEEQEDQEPSEEDQEPSEEEEEEEEPESEQEEPDDDDNDGFDESEDCDDHDPDIHPNANEIPYDGIDNDCDEETLDDDLDEDGFDEDEDCDDGDENINPDMDDDSCDEVDQNCDGQNDEDWNGDSCEPNDSNPYDLGDITNQDLVIIAGNLFPSSDIDRFLFFIDDGWFDIFGFSIVVNSIPSNLDIRLELIYHGDQVNSTSEVIANVNEGHLGEAEEVNVGESWLSSDAGYYELKIVGVSGSSCASPYQITINPDA